MPSDQDIAYKDPEIEDSAGTGVYNSVQAAQDNLQRDQKRKDFELVLEKRIKTALLCFFYVSLVMVFVIFGFYVYYLVRGIEMPNNLDTVAQTLVGIAIGNIVGSVTQSYFRKGKEAKTDD